MRSPFVYSVDCEHPDASATFGNSLSVLAFLPSALQVAGNTRPFSEPAEADPTQNVRLNGGLP
jgi:hypothetical protein